MYLVSEVKGDIVYKYVNVILTEAYFSTAWHRGLLFVKIVLG